MVPGRVGRYITGLLLGWTYRLHPYLVVREFRAGEELQAVCDEDTQLIHSHTRF